MSESWTEGRAAVDRMALDKTRFGTLDGGSVGFHFAAGIGAADDSEEAEPRMRRVHRDTNTIQRWMRKDWFRNWIRMGEVS